MGRIYNPGKITLAVIAILFTLLCISCQDQSKCRDKERRCVQLVKQGNCFRDKDLRKKCPESCGLCRTPAEDAILETVKESHQKTIEMMIGVAVSVFFSIFILWARLRNVGAVCVSKGNMKGKLVVITGATSGIGLDTAFHLALRGAKIVIGCRNLKKGFKVAKDLRNQTGQKFVEVRKLDLESFDSINEFASSVKEEFPKIDVLINNAGVIGGRDRCVTLDGHERTFQVNYLGHFYLTKLLMSNLKENSPSRIINVVSEEFQQGELDFKNLQGLKHFNNLSAYRNANLAVMYFTKELGKMLKESGVTVNAANPGITATNLWQHVFPYSWKITWFFLSPYSYMFWKNSSMGAETTYFCALDRDLASVTGKYFKDCAEEEFPALDDEVGRKLWAVSERLLTPKKMSTLNQAAIKKALNEIVEAEEAKDRGEENVEEAGSQASDEIGGAGAQAEAKHENKTESGKGKKTKRGDDSTDGEKTKRSDGSTDGEKAEEIKSTDGKKVNTLNVHSNGKKKEKGSPHPIKKKTVESKTTSDHETKRESTVSSTISTTSVRKRNTKDKKKTPKPSAK